MKKYVVHNRWLICSGVEELQYWISPTEVYCSAFLSRFMWWTSINISVIPLCFSETILQLKNFHKLWDLRDVVTVLIDLIMYIWTDKGKIVKCFQRKLLTVDNDIYICLSQHASDSRHCTSLNYILHAWRKTYRLHTESLPCSIAGFHNLWKQSILQGSKLFMYG